MLIAIGRQYAAALNQRRFFLTYWRKSFMAGERSLDERRAIPKLRYDFGTSGRVT